MEQHIAAVIQRVLCSEMRAREAEKRAHVAEAFIASITTEFADQAELHEEQLAGIQRLAGVIGVTAAKIR